MKRNFTFFICLNVLIGLFSLAAFGQKASAVEIKGETAEAYEGKLYITVNGKPRKISDAARDAWIINGGKEVVFSWANRERGFEAEGESLSVYDVKTRKTRNVMDESTAVTGLSEVKLSNGKTALLVSLSDGGLGASYFAVVDPQRGQVLSENFTELTQIKADKIKLAFYENHEDWDAINQERTWEFQRSQSALAKPTKVKPAKTQILDLKEILKNKVIYNQTNEEMAAEYDKKYKDVVVYLWSPNEKTPAGQNYTLIAVSKNIPAKDRIAPLRPTLEILFAEVGKEYENSGLTSATFGMKFEGVVLKNGTATVKFSQPPNETNYGSLAPFIFLEAVEKTAKQFPTVKRVEICAVGETLIDSQLDKQFQRCF